MFYRNNINCIKNIVLISKFKSNKIYSKNLKKSKSKSKILKLKVLK